MIWRFGWSWVRPEGTLSTSSDCGSSAERTMEEEEEEEVEEEEEEEEMAHGKRDEMRRG
jgi:hypothetical protein